MEKWKYILLVIGLTILMSIVLPKTMGMAMIEPLPVPNGSRVQQVTEIVPVSRPAVSLLVSTAQVPSFAAMSARCEVAENGDKARELAENIQEEREYRHYLHKYRLQLKHDKKVKEEKKQRAIARRRARRKADLLARQRKAVAKQAQMAADAAQNGNVPKIGENSGTTIYGETFGNVISQAHSYTMYERNWSSGTTQAQLYQLWRNAGSTEDQGYATYHGRVLVALTTYYGDVGDKVDIVWEDGTVMKAIIADQKSSQDRNCTQYGHVGVEGSGARLGVVEYEITKAMEERMSPTGYGDPSKVTHTEWDQNAAKIINQGKIKELS